MKKTKAKKGKPGRPPKITAALEKILWAEIADGSTTKQACQKVGVSYQSVAVKLAQDPEFRDRRARAYLHGSVFYMDYAEEGLRTAKPDNISVRREIAHHARWRASKMLPAFSDRLGVTLDATVTHKLPAHKGPMPSGYRPEALREWFSKFEPQEKMERINFLLFDILMVGHELETLWNLPEASEACRALAHRLSEQMMAAINNPRALPALPAPVPSTPAREEKTLEADDVEIIE